jgi:hypothetical protein
MRTFIILLSVALFSCNTNDNIMPNTIEGKWIKVTNPNIMITFESPNFIYEYNGTTSLYTYEVQGDTVIINNNGNVTKKAFSINEDTLSLENGNIFEKWLRHEQ